MKEFFNPSAVDITEVNIQKEELLDNLYRFLDKRYKEKNIIEEENTKLTVYKKTKYILNTHRIYAIIETQELTDEVQKLIDELLEEVNSYMNKRFSMNNQLTIILILDRNNEKIEEFLYTQNNIPYKGKFKRMDPTKEYKLPVMKIVYCKEKSDLKIGIGVDENLVPDTYIIEFTRCKTLIDKIIKNIE